MLYKIFFHQVIKNTMQNNMNTYKLFQIKLKENFQKISNREKKCSHPNCNKKAIKSHTVSKASNLLKISSSKNIVYSIRNPIFNINNSNFIDFKCGIHKASTYPLFCAKHDTDLFEPFENKNILKITEKHSFLLHYRILNKALYLKEIFYEAYIKAIQNLEDNEQFIKTEDLQNYKNFINDLTEIANVIGIEPKMLIHQKENLDKILMKSNYKNQSYYAIIIDKIPEIQCSTTWIPTLDFDNNELFDLDNYNLHVPSISIDILTFKEKGIILFSWNRLNEFTYSEANIKFIKSLDNILNPEKPMAILHLLFSFSEDIFLSPSWFDSLEDNKKEILKGISRKAFENMSVLKDYKILENFVNWNVIDIKTNISINNEFI